MRSILNMDDKFLKPYNPQETEDKIYKLWEEGGFFKPEAVKSDSAETFSILRSITDQP